MHRGVEQPHGEGDSHRADRRTDERMSDAAMQRIVGNAAATGPESEQEFRPVRRIRRDGADPAGGRHAPSAYGTTERGSDESVREVIHALQDKPTAALATVGPGR